MRRIQLQIPSVKEKKESQITEVPKDSRISHHGVVGYELKIENLSYHVNEKQILHDINFSLSGGNFVALLGENGSGKSTLLDLIMGFRIPKAGKIFVDSKEPHIDDLTLKANTIYLSEKMDVPVYWKISDYLDFHKHFYPSYSAELEEQYMHEYKIKRDTNFRSLSAGENKRAQIVAALASNPQLILIDEITAVLDIVGRQKFMGHLSNLAQRGCTIVLATNILENIELFTSHLILLNKGQLSYFGDIKSFMKNQKPSLFIEQIAAVLEAA
ncbi:MAG: ABC transporter ATP-binding protein [Bdellovibrionota bacterium]